ncbi:hypothetical protein [Brevundimonas sp. TWP2-3-4b1]|uniref:hypothetical protein n=1 Tax=Brevundimonas sp. TWP2-3-4b1 TaxID=2804580 RepID=UPI003CFA61A6
MPKKHLLFWALACTLLATAADSRSRLYPDGRFTGGYGNLDWESGCSKPSFYGDHDEAFADYQTYTSCLRRASRNDAEYASERVLEEAASELRSVNSEGQRAGILSY